MIPTLVISVSIDQSLAVVWLPDQTSRHHLTSPVRKLLYIVLHSKSFMDQTHLVRINGYWQSFFLFWMMLETLRSKLPQTSHCGLRLDFSHLLAERQSNQIGVNWSKQKSSHQCVGNCKNYANSAKKYISQLGQLSKATKHHETPSTFDVWFWSCDFLWFAVCGQLGSRSLYSWPLLHLGP